MNKVELIKKLRSLADHPATPENERESARARIAELQKSVPVVKQTNTKKALRGLRAKVKGAWKLPKQWPFGWTGVRIPVEYESAPAPDGGLAIGWKCPGCGEQVERIISSREIIQLKRPVSPETPDPLSEHIRMMVGGRENQLCRDCWHRYDSE